MVLPDIKITPPGVGIIVPGYRNAPPRRSNQTPEGPANPMPLLVSEFQGVRQGISTRYPHSTPNIDNYQGEHNYQVQQRIKTHIPTNLPPGVNPGSYINESITNPPGIKTVGYQDITGSTGYPRQLSIPGPQPIKQIGYGVDQEGINPWQHRIPITQIVPPGVYPDTYGKRKMSYDGASTFLIGGILGFIAGAIIFTATGRRVASEVTSAASRRVSTYITPKS
jgi:hypothetical protein